MSASAVMSTTDEAVDFPYRAVSRAAIASLLFLVLAIPGLMQTFAPMLVLTLVGILAAVVGWRATTRYANEFSGKSIAIFGLVANSLLFVGGMVGHIYIYMTEVPEGYERVQFYELQQDPKLPDMPTEKSIAIDGADVFLKGYIHPSSGSGMLRQFIMVPDLGTCCFGGQPRSTDMIEVTLTGGQTIRAGMTKIKLAGKFTLNRAPQSVTDFENAVFYRMRVDQIR
jgi:hypothetical protein